MLRKILFWIHLAAGCVAGVVIFIMSVTGTLLAFERQIVDWADRGYRREAPAGAVRLPVEALLEKVRAAGPGVPTGLIVRTDTGAPVSVEFGREHVVYVNPWTGEVLGEGSREVRAFFRETEDWHRWLAVGQEKRASARAITGYSNLLFAFLVCSGVVLWWPRAWRWQHLRAVVWFRGGLQGRAREFNWHNTLGFWACIPLLFIVLTAVVMSFPWANELVYRVNGETAPVRGGRGGGPGRGGRGGGAGDTAVAAEGLNAAWAVAEARNPDWKTITLRPIPAGSGPVTFQIDRGDGRPDLRSQLTVNRRTGEVREEPFSANTPARRLRTWIRFTHTGEAGGIPGRALAALASGAAAVLVYTGFSLSMRRLFRWRAGTRARRRDMVSTVQ